MVAKIAIGAASTPIPATFPPPTRAPAVARPEVIPAALNPAVPNAQRAPKLAAAPALAPSPAPRISGIELVSIVLVGSLIAAPASATMVATGLRDSIFSNFYSYKNLQ